MRRILKLFDEPVRGVGVITVTPLLPGEHSLQIKR